MVIGTGAEGGTTRRPSPEVVAALWPEARHRVLEAFLATGIAREAAEDALGEAVARALSKGLVVDTVDEFSRWLFVVARNLVVDDSRRTQRVVLLGIVPERVDRYDLLHHVETRQRLRDATDVIAEMSATDRVALLADVGRERDPAASRREAVREAVRRHRARSRLRQALGAPAAWLGSERPQSWAWRHSTNPGEAIAALMVSLPLLAGSSWFASPSAAAGVAPTAPPSHAATTMVSVSHQAAAATPIVAPSPAPPAQPLPVDERVVDPAKPQTPQRRDAGGGALVTFTDDEGNRILVVGVRVDASVDVPSPPVP